MNLVGKRLEIDAASRKLYLKDKQVWGEILLTYALGVEATSTEQAELEKSGFSANGYKRYQRKIEVAGTITPAIKLTNEQLPKLTTIRPINFYNPRDVKPPDNIGANLLIPVAIVADIALSPVYLAGFLVLLIGAH